MRKRRAPSSTCRALILIDSTAIRRRAWADCKRSRTTFEKAERELRLAEADKEHYHHWFHQTSGPQIQEAKSLMDDLNALRVQEAEMADLMDYHGCSSQQAHRRWTRGERAPEPLVVSDPFLDGIFDEQADGEEEEAEYSDELESILLEILREAPPPVARMRRSGMSSSEILDLITEGLCAMSMAPRILVEPLLQRPAFQAYFRRKGLLDPAHVPPVAASPARDPLAARIKQLARELAFALHPDQADSSDPQRLELWHEVQAAVKAKDLARLEVLQAHLHLLEGPDLHSKAIPVSRIHHLTGMYRRSRQAVRDKLRDDRKSDWWKFSAWSDAQLRHREREIAAAMEDELTQARQHLEAFRQEINAWARPRRRR